MSELTDAIKQGDATRVAEVLDRNPELLQSNDDPVTPILFAIYHGKRDLAKMLIERGAPVSFTEACALGDADRVQRMLDGNPSLLNERSADGFPPLGLAIFFQHPELARLLIERGADVHAAAENSNRVAPVHAAAAACDRDTMRLLLERGADPNARQQLDFTPLHGAASRGDVEMAKLLLAHGAERTPKGSNGETPADVARSHGQPDFATWIESL